MELETIPDFITAGDALTVVRIDRLGRSTRNVLNLVHDLESRGASLRVQEPNIDTGTPEGRIILTRWAMVAEMELTFMGSTAPECGIVREAPRPIDF
ncbi:MAG: recombinase family protein [Cypionkella sp.]